MTAPGEGAPRKPCATCPWKRSTPRHGFPGGRIDADGLRRAIHGSPLDPAMQCHSTPDGAGAEVCAGFAVVVGFDSVPLRMAALLGKHDPRAVTSGGEPLHTPSSMLRFHGRAKKARARVDT